jgi:hypothetical protein
MKERTRGITEERKKEKGKPAQAESNTICLSVWGWNRMGGERRRRKQERLRMKERWRNNLFYQQTIQLEGLFCLVGGSQHLTEEQTEGEIKKKREEKG